MKYIQKIWFWNSKFESKPLIFEKDTMHNLLGDHFDESRLSETSKLNKSISDQKL